MKILHIAQMAKGGPASYLGEIIPYQVGLLGAANVRVVAPADQLQYFVLAPTDGIEPVIPVEAFSRRSLWNLLRFLVLTMFVIRAERPDFLHLHSTYAGVMVRLWYLCSLARRPRIIYCSHGWAFNMRVSERKRRIYAWIERRMLAATDRIICISAFEYNEAVRRGLPAEKMVVIRNAVQNRPPVDAPDGSIYNPATLNLLFIGRHDPQKGIDILMQAMRLLEGKPITLHVVGESVVSTGKAMESLDNVVFHGWQSRERVDHFIAGADTIVMPSRWEGFGLVAIEAMRQGTPVCAAAVDALPEIVRDGVSGFLFEPENPQALADLLGRLDRSMLKAMAVSAREWFLQYYTSERLNAEILTCYREVA